MYKTYAYFYVRDFELARISKRLWLEPMYKFYKINTLSVIGFSIVLGFASLLLVYYVNPLRVEAQTQSLLVFEVSTSENSYLQLEPIPINFKLSNPTANPIGCAGYLGIGANINLISRAENGTEFRWIGDFGLDSPIMDLTVQPNSHIQKSDLISSSLARRLFPNPGRYELQVEFVQSKYVNQQKHIEIIKADPVVIQIKSPQGINQSAYQFLINQNLIEGGESLSGRVVKQQNFVNNFPNSALATQIENARVRCERNSSHLLFCELFYDKF